MCFIIAVDYTVLCCSNKLRKAFDKHLLFLSYWLLFTHLLYIREYLVLAYPHVPWGFAVFMIMVYQILSDGDIYKLKSSVSLFPIWVLCRWIMDEWNLIIQLIFSYLFSIPSKHLYLVFNLDSSLYPHLYQFYQPVDLIRFGSPDNINITFTLLLLVMLFVFFEQITPCSMKHSKKPQV